MNLTQISEHVYKLTIEAEIGMPILINTWYVVKDNGVYIIDTGIEQYAELQIKAAQLLGEPKTIFLTHGHVDHIGSAKTIKEKFNIDVYAHSNELKYINNEEAYPNKDKIENTNISYEVKALKRKYFDGLPLKYILTPGHSPGHVVFYHEEDEVLMCGDLFISEKESLHPPIKKFTYNINENIESGSIIDELKPKIITTSHGYDMNYSKNAYKIYRFKYEESLK
ncbi:MBL fold metallo-hydrolase [Staphylococcus caprae]